jgi:hypothetical protein
MFTIKRNPCSQSTGTRNLKARMRDAELVFMLYGADGALLMKFDSVEEAVETVAANGLCFAAIH